MKKAVIFGAGKIGRGFLGQLFYESGYETVFVELDQKLVNQINQKKSYPVKIVSPGQKKEVTVKNVEAIQAHDQKKIAAEIADTDLVATAVGVGALPRIVGTLVAGFRCRWEKESFAPLNIILCENLVDADSYLEKHILEKLSSKEKKIYQENVGLVRASIGRMVPEVPAEVKEEHPLAVVVEPYDKLPVDKAGIKGPEPELKNMIPFSPFDFYIKRKLYMHNMAHAVTAYLGNRYGYDYIWEAISDPAIKYITAKALQEAAVALAREYQVSLEKLLAFGDNLIFRFNNQVLGDTVGRVGRDLKRKLSSDDRLVGTINLCRKHNLVPVYVIAGLAAGYLFNPGNNVEKNAKEIRDLTSDKGIKKAVEDISLINEGKIKKIIAKFYVIMENEASLLDVLAQAEFFSDQFNSES
ncbi:MAG: mannitol dehydrogenase [Halanaerobiaceae bacterium]